MSVENQLISKFPNYSSYKLFKKGYVADLYIFESNNKKYILKIFNKKIGVFNYDKLLVSEMFSREVEKTKLLNKIKDKNVVTPKIVFSSRKNMFYVTEYIEFVSLNKYIFLNLFNQDNIYKKYKQIIFFINKFHKKYLVKENKSYLHGDLNSKNIGIMKDGLIYIFDPGYRNKEYINTIYFDLSRILLSLYQYNIFLNLLILESTKKKILNEINSIYSKSFKDFNYNDFYQYSVNENIYSGENYASKRLIKNSLMFISSKIINIQLIMSKKINRNLSKIIKILISLFLVFLISQSINTDQLFSILSKTDKLLVLNVVFLTFITSIIYVYRSFFIFKNFYIKDLNFIKFYLLNRAGNLMNFIVPGGAGQELSKLIVLKDIRKKELLHIFLLDRLSGLFSLMLMVSIFYKELSFFSFNNNLLLVLLLSLMSLIIIVSIWSLKKTRINIVSFLFSFFLSTVYSILLVFISKLTFKSVGVNVDIEKLMYIVPSISILTMLPISINGIGVREYLLNYLLDINIESIIAYTLIGYSIYLLLNFPGFFFIFRHRTLSNKNLDE